MADSLPSQVKVLWSTQSGRAKACARRVVRILRENYDVQILSQAAFDDDPNLLRSNGEQDDPVLWILLVSTTGDGEHCDSIQTTWKQLLSKLNPPTMLSHIRFALYCLGDRAYGPQFCAAGRKLGARLVQLGATSACPVGYGDDGTPNGGVFYDMDVWLKESLFPILPKRDEVIVDDPSVTSLYKVEAKDEELKEDEMSWYQDFFASLAPPTAYRIQQQGMYPRVGTVVSNDRLTDPSWEQNTRHLVISVLSAKEKLYHAGDICSVLPRNSDQAVQDFLQVLPAEISNNADRTLGVSIRVEDHSVPWPRQCTLRGWLTYCADICGLPEREDLRALSYYCRSPEQADKLQSLSETSGSALYADYVLREKRSWRDVLYDFDGLNLDLNSLFQLLPSLRARHFSIASPSSLDKVELCVAVVEGTTPLGRSYHGLCSNYLANLKSGNLIRFWLKPGSFQHLPLTIKSLTAQYEAPILCIGAGTGIAPLRSIILEREQHRPLIDLLTDFPECDARLVFGCRKKSMDYYYENDWDHLEAARRFRVWTAFSRDQWHKIYVQQVMGQHKDVIVKHILQDQGAIYIAGGAKMARAVKDELLEILGEAMGDDKTAQLLVKQFQRRGLYAVEAWS